MNFATDQNLLDFAQNSQQIFNLGFMYSNTVLNGTNFANSRKKGGQKSKKSHMDIDPNAPKRPLSSYILYFQDVQAKFKEKNAELPMNEITKLIGQSWKNLNEGEKKKYKDISEKQKDNYGVEMAKYKSENQQLTLHSAENDNSQSFDKNHNFQKSQENSRNFLNSEPNSQGQAADKKQYSSNQEQQFSSEHQNLEVKNFQNQQESEQMINELKNLYPNLSSITNKKVSQQGSLNVSKQQPQQQQQTSQNITKSLKPPAVEEVQKKSPAKKKLQKIKVKQKLLDEINDDLPEEQETKQNDIIKFDAPSVQEKKIEMKKKKHIDEGDDGFIDDDDADQNHIDYGYYNIKENQDDAAHDCDDNSYYFREYLQDKQKKNQSHSHVQQQQNNKYKQSSTHQQQSFQKQPYQEPSFNQNKQMEQLKFDTNEDLDVGMKIKKKIKKT